MLLLYNNQIAAQWTMKLHKPSTGLLFKRYCLH